MKIVATTSLPAVDRPNADHWNAARSRQLYAFLTLLLLELLLSIAQLKITCIFKTSFLKITQCEKYFFLLGQTDKEEYNYMILMTPLT